jgi:ribosomal protein S19
MRLLCLLLMGNSIQAQKTDYPEYLRITASKFAGRLSFHTYSDTNDSPVYKSDSIYPINDETKSNLYLGMVQGRGIQDYEGDDFWSLNTKDDMFGLYLAQFESTEIVPLFPSNTTQLRWSRADFGLESIQPIHNEPCPEQVAAACGGAHCQIVHGYAECDCLPGYEYKEGQCLDINECDKDLCELDCLNTDGSYVCYDKVTCQGHIYDIEQITGIGLY